MLSLAGGMLPKFILSMEDTSEKYAESLSRFQDFVSTVSFSAGGAK